MHKQLPFFGSIPIIGWLFKNVEHVHSKSQLLIFVTPHIYYGADASVNVDDEILKDQDPDAFKELQKERAKKAQAGQGK